MGLRAAKHACRQGFPPERAGLRHVACEPRKDSPASRSEQRSVPPRQAQRRAHRLWTSLRSCRLSPLPSRPIERGRPGPGLLAHVFRLHPDRNGQTQTVDPPVWLADTLARIPDYKITNDLLPWRWNG
jgi:hypothetical protein